MRFVDLFAGLGGFHQALANLGHECVFASELNEELRHLYTQNFPNTEKTTFGDIRHCKDLIPPHDVLCAGFPCQPFSKSGSQLGKLDKTRGTLFHEIVHILTKHRPAFLILENVGNFERHDDGRTWAVVREILDELGYHFRGTEHVRSGGPGLLSPHHLGFPHSRERFFIVAQLTPFAQSPFPSTTKVAATTLSSIVQSTDELSDTDRKETSLTPTQVECIDHWNTLLRNFPEGQVDLPSFPLWSDEFGATYPYQDFTPFSAPIEMLIESLDGKVPKDAVVTHDDLVAFFPSYAREPVEKFEGWKQAFIRQNREWFTRYNKHFPDGWLERLRLFPSSLRKLEWNCKGEERDLWKYVLQFRPSGLRVKRYTSIPALVAMTTTQIPILGPERRFITRVEALRLQGFRDNHQLPVSREKAFKALGNAVHVGVVEAIARRLVGAANPTVAASAASIPEDAPAHCT